MKYVMVLLTPFYRLSEDIIACESAFALHLKELLPRVSQWATQIVIHSPLMTESEYVTNKYHLVYIHCKKENIFYIESISLKTSRLAFLLQAPFVVWPKIWKLVKSATVVHASVSKDIFKAFSIIALLFALIQGKKNLCIIDIDHRHSAKMAYKAGHFSYKSYLIAHYIYNPLISLQIRFVTQFCPLVMLKGQALVDDYGKGRDTVKNFYDTTHDLSFILTERELEKKLVSWETNKQEIRLVYFGRLTKYKGIKDIILATKKVEKRLKQEQSNKTISLSIIGSGDLEAELQTYVNQEDLHNIIIFYDALHYGDKLFKHLKKFDFLLAAPHTEDTPRSTFDAMACGLPTIAYNTYYYQDLEKKGTSTTVPWLSIDAMADRIITLINNPITVKKMILESREFAINNTQKIWLDKRLSWTQQYL